jgi:hypothetical protein
MSLMVSRRYFLKAGSVAVAGAAVGPSFLFGRAEKDHPVFIAIFQRGAADGISMVVPFGDKNYYAVRPQIAIPEPSRSATERAIDLDGFFALHPALGSLKGIYDERHLAIIHAVGSPANTRSHFDAQDYMESGTRMAQSLHASEFGICCLSFSRRGAECQYPAYAYGPGEHHRYGTNCCLWNPRRSGDGTTRRDIRKDVPGHIRCGEKAEKCKPGTVLPGKWR